MEEWRDVLLCKGIYRVSNKGRVYSIISGIIMKQHMCCGYLIVPLKAGNRKNKSPRVHILVAEAFILNPLNKPYINHLNGKKTDNRVENLEWCTAKENHRHAIDTGLKSNPIGSGNGNSFLKEEQILEIRRKYATGNYYQRELAQEYNTGQGHIGRIVKKQAWKHI